MNRSKWLGQVALSVCVLFLPLLAHAQDGLRKQWLIDQVQKQPEVVAAREQWLGSNAYAQALEQPLHNPELSTEFERVGQQDNHRFGLSQTLDWWNKRDAQGQKAIYLRRKSEFDYQSTVLRKTAEALVALVQWRAAERAAEVAQAQQRQLNTLVKLAETRRKVGDIGSVDAELTFLSLSKQLVQVSEREVALSKATSKLRELLPDWSSEQAGVPNHFWPLTPEEISDEVLRDHPAVASAYASWQSLKVDTEIAKLNARAEPTVGFNAGRDGGERVVGMTFSIPLNVRNGFSAETRVADRAEQEAKALFEAVYRRQRFDFEASKAAWHGFNRQYQHWQNLVEGRIENSEMLLEKQWRSGDLSTSDYLLALNQRVESLLAGIELEKLTQLARIEVLEQSGQLNRVIGLSEKSTN